MTEPELGGRLDAWAARVERTLESALPSADSPPARLHQAMRYSALQGGKRIRPALVYATGEMLGVPLDQLDAPAAAVEMIHVYSLVHDDLPAMDDDDVRRGRPTCHRKFGEATAILAGDALQVLAFATLTRAEASAAQKLRMMALLAEASGTAGMAGGQAIDLAAVGRTLELAQIEAMHRLKTGALVRASVLLPAELADGLDPDQYQRLGRFGAALGLAFQIVDDILDVEGDAAALGKATGADRARGKPTYPAVAGLPASRARAAELYGEALGALSEPGPKADALRALAAFMVLRRH